eukprot:676133_1
MGAIISDVKRCFGDEDDDEVAQIGMKFEMGKVTYSVVSVSEQYVKCAQLEANKNDEFPQEILLSQHQLNHVKVIEGGIDIIAVGQQFKMSNINYEIASIANDKQYVKCHQVGDKKVEGFPNEIVLSMTQLKHVAFSENNLKIGTKFKMGNVVYSIASMNETYVKCNQLNDASKQDEFPSQVVLTHNQLRFVKPINV